MGRKKAKGQRGYDIFSNTGFKQCNSTCRSVEQAPGCVSLNNGCSPLPWEDAHLEKSTTPINLCVVSPGVWPQAVLRMERGRSGVSSTAGMRGLWSLHGAGRRETEVWLGTRWLERHGVLKDMLLPSGVQEAGMQHGACGRGRSHKGFPGLLLFLWSMELMSGFPQQLFLARFWFPWKSPSAPASAALLEQPEQLPACARGLREAAAFLHSQTSKARSQSIPRSGVEEQIRTRVTQTGEIVPVTSNRQYNKN